MKARVIFGDEKVKIAFDKLKESKIEEPLYHVLTRAFTDLEENAFCAIQIPKRLIPKEYSIRFGHLDNLWKYNLPKGWRVVYTIKNDEIVVLCIILEWMTHKKYERRFRYG